MKKYLITGGLGFVGSNLVPLLLEQSDCRITILDNLSNPSEELTVGSNIKLVEGDIRDTQIVDQVVKEQDVVIHLAAHTRVIDSIEDPLLNFEINARGTFNILDSMRNNGVKTIISASTGGAILGEVPPPVNEEIAANPASPYGASKLAAEGYCSAFSQSYGMSAVSLRFSNLYGPFSKNKGSVVSTFVRNIKTSGNITIYGDGSQTRDYLYIDDLVKGIVSAIDSGVSGVYQLGSGIPTSINKLIEMLRKEIKVEFNIDYKEFRSGELKHTYCDISKAKREFNYDPVTTLSQGLQKTVNWFDSILM